eukprot:169609-Alexandrium_andersonii.AAC.1
MARCPQGQRHDRMHWSCSPADKHWVVPEGVHVQACWLSRCNSVQVGAPAASLWPTRPVGKGATPSTEAHWGPLRAAPSRA